MFVPLSFLMLPLYCLSFFNVRLLITPFVFSNLLERFALVDLLFDILKKVCRWWFIFVWCSHYTFVLLRYMPSNYNFGISQLLCEVRVAQYFVFCVVFNGPLFFLLPFPPFTIVFSVLLRLTTSDNLLDV